MFQVSGMKVALDVNAKTDLRLQREETRKKSEEVARKASKSERVFVFFEAVLEINHYKFCLAQVYFSFKINGLFSFANT